MRRCWCGEPATASFLERIGTVPPEGHNDKGKASQRDRSGLYPRSVCEAHRPMYGFGPDVINQPAVQTLEVRP